MNKEELLNLAKQIAQNAHKGQYRRDGLAPYIVHPRDVSRHPSLKGDVYAEAVAWLHDILEESDLYSAEDLLFFEIPKEVVDAVVAMTKKKGESYESYLYRVAANDIAREVKIADMIINLADSPTRKQIAKYGYGLHFLTNVGYCDF